MVQPVHHCHQNPVSLQFCGGKRSAFLPVSRDNQQSFYSVPLFGCTRGIFIHPGLQPIHPGEFLAEKLVE
jgi:hypothetical protein